MSAQATATQHLQAHLAGDPAAEARLSPIVYQELRRIAARLMRRERADHTLQPTALANEALIRLIRDDAIDGRARSEFLGIAARTMRRVLIDHARARQAAKRAGEREGITYLDPSAEPGADPIDLLALHEALERLGQLSTRQAEVVELKFFGGLTLEETARAIGIGRETAKDHWTLARAWLNRELSKGERR